MFYVREIFSQFQKNVVFLLHQLDFEIDLSPPLVALAGCCCISLLFSSSTPAHGEVMLITGGKVKLRRTRNKNVGLFFHK